MKVLGLVIALLIGFAATEWVLHRPEDAAAQKEKALKEFNDISEAAWTQMEQQYRDACRSRWLKKTSCFQAKGMKAEECVKMIERKCGTER